MRPGQQQGRDLRVPSRASDLSDRRASLAVPVRVRDRA